VHAGKSLEAIAKANGQTTHEFLERANARLTAGQRSMFQDALRAAVSNYDVDFTRAQVPLTSAQKIGLLTVALVVLLVVTGMDALRRAEGSSPPGSGPFSSAATGTLDGAVAITTAAMLLFGHVRGTRWLAQLMNAASESAETGSSLLRNVFVEDKRQAPLPLPAVKGGRKQGVDIDGGGVATTTLDLPLVQDAFQLLALRAQ
jgi:hypothetical protein